jgi:hypothetical protein
MSDHPPSATTRVRVVRGRDHAALLAALVADLGLHAVVTAARKRTRAKLAELPVAVLVSCGVVAPADPDLVGVVLAALTEIGCRDVRLLAAIPQRERDAGWTAAALALRHGYRDLRDPHHDLAPVDVPEWSVHHGVPLPRDWTSAAVRLVISSSATDARHGCSLSVATIMAGAPLVPGCAEAEAAVDLLRILPPDLVILDATVTSHGIAGSARRRPLTTDTLVGSTSALLVDVVGAALLGLDAADSPLLATALACNGLPVDYAVEGSLEPFPDVSLTPTAVRLAARDLSDADPSLGRLLDAALVATVLEHDGDEADPVLRTLRAGLEPWVLAAESAGGEVGLVAAINGIAGLATWVGGWQTSFGKDSLTRRAVPLGLDLDDWSDSDYDAVAHQLRPLESVVAALPRTVDGMRWTHLDGDVLFEITRTMRAPYRDWIARVDLSRAVSLMADYLGGRRVVVSRDEGGRPTRQAERNVYLPQPNYVAFAGARVIDVCKLDFVEYEDARQKIWWRTVHSPNGTADHDDGSVEFADAGGGRTLVTVRGRQRFTLPPSLQLVDLDAMPELRDALTDDAYRRFFATTLDNFVACYEGRDWAVGRPPDTDLASLRFSRLIEVARAAAADAGSGFLMRDNRSGPGAEPATQPDVVDSDGFRHVRGMRG